jgi:hypothetical protein
VSSTAISKPAPSLQRIIPEAGDPIARLFAELSSSAPGATASSTMRELGEVIEARDRLHKAITTLPSSVFDFRVRALLVTFLSCVVPILVGFGVQAALEAVAPLVQTAIQSIGSVIR